MDRKYRILVILALGVLILNNLPILVNILPRKDGLKYIGRRVINSHDLFTYVSYIEQIKQGRFLIENQHTSEEQKPSLLRPSYILIGKFAALLHLPSLWAYHLSRIFLTVLFFVVSFKFLSLYFPDLEKRIWVFLLLITSSGLGFLVKPVFSNSTDLWMPETITFLSFSEAPHFILSLILMLVGCWFFLKKNKANKDAYISGLAFFWLSFEHPYNLFVVIPVLFITTIFASKKQWRKLFITIAFIVFGLFFQFVDYFANPNMSAWKNTIMQESPKILSYLAGYGLILVFALAGLEFALRNLNKKNTLLVSWVVVTCVLLYAPFKFQRRFVEGVHIALSILAGFGIFAFVKFVSKYYLMESRREFYNILLGFIVFILSLSSIYSVYNDMKVIREDHKDSYFYHLLPDELQAMQFLKTQTSFDDVVLSNWFYGNIISGLAGRKVYIGDKRETIDFDKKVELTNTFLKEESDQKAVEFLKKNNITYIYLGKDDSMLRYGFRPFEKPFLSNIFNQNGVYVFKVN